MTPRHVLLAAAFLLALAAAFLAGIAVAGLGTRDDRVVADNGSPPGRRDPYSPRILDDPEFLQQQREGIRALAAHCRRTGEYCEEARQGMAWLAEHDPSR